MRALSDISRVLGAVLAAVVLAAVLTPVCGMPECTNLDVGPCSDFKPACDDCPEPVVMKHSHDDAVTVAGYVPAEVAFVAVVIEDVAPAPVALAVVELAPTASPPPLDPLGVRLLV